MFYHPLNLKLCADGRSHLKSHNIKDLPCWKEVCEKRKLLWQSDIMKKRASERMKDFYSRLENRKKMKEMMQKVESIYTVNCNHHLLECHL